MPTVHCPAVEKDHGIESCVVDSDNYQFDLVDKAADSQKPQDTLGEAFIHNSAWIGLVAAIPTEESVHILVT